MYTHCRITTPFILFLTIILGFSLTTTGCEKSPPPPDTTSTIHKLELPEDTRFVARIHPRKTAALLDELRPLLHEDFRALEGPSGVTTLVLAMLLAGQTPLQTDHIAPDQDLIIALSSRGNQPHLAAIANNQPFHPEKVENTFRGFSWRVYIPFNNDEALTKAQATLSTHSSMIPHVTRTENYLVIDIMEDIHQIMGRIFSIDVDPLSFEHHDNTYLTRHTPALQDFLTSQSAVSLYLRSDDLAAITTLRLSSLLEDQRLEIPAFQRDAHFQQAFEHLVDLQKLSTHTHQEIEDQTILVDFHPSTGLLLENRQTYTRTGKALADAPDTATTPEWMLTYKNDPHALLALFGHSILPTLFTLTYPRALKAGMIELDIYSDQVPTDWTDFDRPILLQLLASMPLFDASALLNAPESTIPSFERGLQSAETGRVIWFQDPDILSPRSPLQTTRGFEPR